MTIVAALLKFLFISRFLEYQIRRGRTRWKANTLGYKGTLDFIVFRFKFTQEPGQRTYTVLLMEKVSPIHLQSLLPHQSQRCLPFIHATHLIYVLLRSFVTSKLIKQIMSFHSLPTLSLSREHA